MSSLHLPAAHRASIEAWAAEGYPREVCGLLIGRRHASSVEVVRVTKARNLNVERAHDRYELDPRDFLAADRAAQREGLEVLGVWHTHPDHPARPSPTDRDSAWPEWSYLIAAVTGEGVGEITSWRLADTAGDFEQERIEP